jgi:hypothetical protein
MSKRLRVKYLLFLSDFNETCIYFMDFRKKTQILSLIKIRPGEAELFHANRRRNMKRIVDFRNFASAATKNSCLCRNSTQLLGFPALGLVSVSTTVARLPRNKHVLYRILTQLY